MDLKFKALSSKEIQSCWTEPKVVKVTQLEHIVEVTNFNTGEKRKFHYIGNKLINYVDTRSNIINITYTRNGFIKKIKSNVDCYDEDILLQQVLEFNRNNLHYDLIL